MIRRCWCFASISLWSMSITGICFLLFIIHVSIVSLFLLLVWLGHVHFLLIMFGRSLGGLALSSVQCVACLLEFLFHLCALTGLATWPSFLVLQDSSLKSGFLVHVLSVVCTWVFWCYLRGCFQRLCLTCAHQWLFTMAFGCGLCSTSFPGGHQVDGLPPASSVWTTILTKRRVIPCTWPRAMLRTSSSCLSRFGQ